MCRVRWKSVAPSSSGLKILYLIQRTIRDERFSRGEDRVRAINVLSETGPVAIIDTKHERR